MHENTVLLGVTPLTKSIFDEEFPSLKQLELPSYNIRYSAILPLWMKLGLDAPRISRIITNENKVLDKIISENKIEVVISDNRFGLHSKKAQSIFITHQLFLKVPVFSSMANRINKKHILNFDEVWVPDYENESESLSGELSHGKHFHKNIKYIGPQSRLKDVVVSPQKKKYDYLILLSGPEPTRSQVEKSLVGLIGFLREPNDYYERIALVRGTINKENKTQDELVDVFDLPSKEELKKLILSSKKILCMSGYSTLMDMHLLGKNDLSLTPTPGQSEQEYLAEYWRQKFNSELLPIKKKSYFTL